MSPSQAGAPVRRFIPAVASAVCVILALSLLLSTGCERSDSPGHRARHAMVVSGESLATSVGRDILREGGNAIDAAVAVGFALAVTYPEAGNLGGGGFMTLWIPDSGAFTIDFRERAPAAASANMYSQNPSASIEGCLAAGVPGTTAGLLLALERFGSLPVSSAIQPAIDLAKKGITVTPRLERLLEEYNDDLVKYPSTRNIFFPGGHPLRAGAILRQDDLASTLERIRDGGKDGFYSGRTMDLIEHEVTAGMGIITEEDLTGYRARVRPPIVGEYRGYRIVSMGLPSSGGICLLKMLQLLEPYDLRDSGHNTARTIHLMAESMKRAYALRAEYLGDPDYVDVPVDELLALNREGGPGQGINEERATPADSLRAYPFHFREGTETTHYSVIDGDNRAVAVTYTINDLFGNKVVVDGAGFFLNDEMDDFVTSPGEPNMYGLVGGVENMIEPGKRPLSSMSPTIVLKEGEPVLILGARGGPRIITSILQVICNVIDFGMTPADAVGAPRVHHQWSPDVLLYEEGGLPPETIRTLEEKGHRVRGTPGSIGQLEVIVIDRESGWRYGASDPRDHGSAAGF